MIDSLHLVYQKPTHTERYIPFNSYQNQKTITGVLRVMRDCVHNICDPSTKPKELQQRTSFPQQVRQQPQQPLLHRGRSLQWHQLTQLHLLAALRGNKIDILKTYSCQIHSSERIGQQVEKRTSDIVESQPHEPPIPVEIVCPQSLCSTSPGCDTIQRLLKMHASRLVLRAVR